MSNKITPPSNIKLIAASVVSLLAIVTSTMDLKARYDSNSARDVLLQNDVTVLKVDVSEMKTGIRRLETEFGTRVGISDNHEIDPR